MCHSRIGHGMHGDWKSNHYFDSGCVSDETHFGFNKCKCETSHRHFMTKEEKIERLEAYREQLKKEIKAVEEHLEKFKG